MSVCSFTVYILISFNWFCSNLTHRFFRSRTQFTNDFQASESNSLRWQGEKPICWLMVKHFHCIILLEGWNSVNFCKGPQVKSQLLWFSKVTFWPNFSMLFLQTSQVIFSDCMHLFIFVFLHMTIFIYLQRGIQQHYQQQWSFCKITF